MKENNWIIKKTTAIWISIASALLIMFVCYIQNNIPYPYYDDIEHYSKLEYLKRKVCGEVRNDSDVVYINVAYDKKLVEYADPEIGMPEGNIDITDREKLYKFLTILHKEKLYKYVFLDVRFERGYDDKDSLNEKTVDEKLYGLIANMSNIVVSHHGDINIADSLIYPKTARNDYFATITATNFVRYHYIEDGEESVPLRMYKEINRGKMSSLCGIYGTDGVLSYNCPFLRIPFQFPSKYDENGELQYLNLGTDVLDVMSGEDIANLVKGKIVIIGDMIEDVHDTYVGMQPGSYITYNAYMALVDGNNKVNWWFWGIMFLVYIMTSLFMFSRKKMIEHIPYISKSDSKILRFVLSLIGYSAIMLAISDVVYLLCGDTYCIWFPSLYFATLSTITSYFKS